MSITEQLEEAAAKLYEGDNALSYEQAIQLSQAISLKRIADVLTIRPPLVAELKPDDIERLKQEYSSMKISMLR